MKKSMKSKKIFVILLIAFLSITTKVYATDSFETFLAVNSSQVKAEDTITLTIGLTNIDVESGEKGIGGYTARVTFDSSVLEYISTNGTDKWDAPFYEDGLITAVTKDGSVVNTQQSIGTITFKVKKEAKLGETSIGLENFSGANPPNFDIATGKKSVKFTIISNNNVGGSDTSVSTGTNNGSSTNNGANGQSTSKNLVNTKKENMKNGVLPKAGGINVATYAVIGGIVLGIVFYVRFKIIDRKLKNK